MASLKYLVLKEMPKVRYIEDKSWYANIYPCNCGEAKSVDGRRQSTCIPEIFKIRGAS